MAGVRPGGVRHTAGLHQHRVIVGHDGRKVSVFGCRRLVVAGLVIRAWRIHRNPHDETTANPHPSPPTRLVRRRPSALGMVFLKLLIC